VQGGHKLLAVPDTLEAPFKHLFQFRDVLLTPVNDLLEILRQRPSLFTGDNPFPLAMSSFSLPQPFGNIERPLFGCRPMLYYSAA
jgi:hypothetical protein